MKEFTFKIKCGKECSSFKLDRSMIQALLEGEPLVQEAVLNELSSILGQSIGTVYNATKPKNYVIT